MAPKTGAVTPAEFAYERIRADIVSGRLTANQRLIEADLAGELDVSRATVRSMLVRLEHDGLVVREYNHGARVRMVSAEEAVQILQARSALEALAARHAALNATDEDIVALRAIRNEMPTLIADADLLGYSERNSRLHGRIIQASRHGVTQRLISSLKAQMVRYQYRTILVPGRPKKSLAEHTAVVEAITAHDAEAAEAAMRYHLSQVACTLREITGVPHRHTHNPVPAKEADHG
jgi:DNA-binding GntR family transcriptional regulator